MAYLKKRNIFELNTQNTFLILLAILFVRIISILNSPLGLTVDEAQYWDWSNNLEFGYFSKPPLISWLIAFTTYFFGMSEWSIRLSSPILHLAISLIIWLISKNIYNVKVANLNAIIWAILPLTSFGSLIISTDTPLLFFWCLSLFALLKTLESDDKIWPIFLGASMGLGFLAKYAILYFIVILFFLLLFNQRFKKNVLKLILSILIFLIVSSPNLYWNYINDLSTFSHTAYNANLNEISLNYFEPIKFIISQLIICGPIIVIAYFIKVVKIKSYTKNELLLICFSLPIIILIIIQAFLKNSNANWAATALPSLVILIGSFFLKKNKTILTSFILLNLILNFFIFLFLTKTFIKGSFYPIELKSDPLRKLKGYPEQSNSIDTLIETYKPIALLFTKRNDITKFNYYLRINNKNIKKYYLTLRENPINHYEYFYDFRTHSLKKGDLIFLINSYNGIDSNFSKYFDYLNTIKIINYNLNENKKRTYYVIKGTIK